MRDALWDEVPRQRRQEASGGGIGDERRREHSSVQQEVGELQQERRHWEKGPNGKGRGDVRDGPEDKEAGRRDEEGG